MTRLLEGKNAIIFAAGGTISRSVARQMARQGARLHLSHHRIEPVEAFARELIGEGHEVWFSEVDATDAAAVRACVEGTARTAGSVDIVFNGIGGRPADLGYPARSDETAFDDFMRPMQRIVGSQFLTSREGARHMARQGEGSIVTLSATLSGSAFAYMAGISAACGAVETMTQSLAGEFGPKGVRINCLRASAMPETRTIQETVAGQAAIRHEASDLRTPPLGRSITLEETAKTAVFLASDLSSGLTAQMITVCAGQFPTHV